MFFCVLQEISFNASKVISTERFRDSAFTQWIMWDAFEDDSVCGEKESSLCWQDVRAPEETPSGFLPAVRVQQHPQAL